MGFFKKILIQRIKRSQIKNATHDSNITRDHRERLTKIVPNCDKNCQTENRSSKITLILKTRSDTNCSDKEHGLACGIKACTIEHGDLGAKRYIRS